MKLTVEEVKKIAGLAKLRIEEGEYERYAEQLSAILSYVGTLSEVDAKGVSSLTQLHNFVNHVREDEVIGSRGVADDILARAPRTKGRYIMIKKDSVE